MFWYFEVKEFGVYCFVYLLYVIDKFINVCKFF